VKDFDREDCPIPAGRHALRVLNVSARYLQVSHVMQIRVWGPVFDRRGGTLAAAFVVARSGNGGCDRRKVNPCDSLEMAVVAQVQVNVFDSVPAVSRDLADKPAKRDTPNAPS
jgi:hypothetical protein